MNASPPPIVVQSGVYVPGSHERHSTVPVAGVYVPAPHGLQVNQSMSALQTIAYPMSHRHRSSVAPSTDVDKAGQAWQPGFTPSV